MKKSDWAPITIGEHVRTYRKNDLVEVVSGSGDTFRAVNGKGREGKYILIQALVRVDAPETQRAIPERLLKSARYGPHYGY